MKNKEIKQIPTQFDKSKEAESISRDLISKYHTSLINSKIAYLFKNKPILKGGKVVIATAEKCSVKSNALVKYDDEDTDAFDFIITISYPAWNRLNDKQRIAIIDHELEHCLITEDENTGDKKISIVSHDVEEFASIIRRHGLYKEDLQKIKNVMDACEIEVEDDE